MSSASNTVSGWSLYSIIRIPSGYACAKAVVDEREEYAESAFAKKN